MNSAGSNPKADARDLRKEPGRVGDNENPGTPEEMDGSPEPSQGPGGEAPIAERPSSPLEEGGSVEFSPLRVSKNLDGPDSDPSEVRDEPLSGSKYVSTGILTHLKRGYQPFSNPPWQLRKKKWNQM